MLTAALARHLHASGLAQYDPDDPDDPDVETTAFLEDLPAQPAAALGIYATGGNAPSGAVGMRRPGVQVIVRGDRHNGRARSGYEVAEAILEALDGSGHVVWGAGTPDAVRVAWCLAKQSAPINLGDDANGSPRWSVRFDVETNGAAE